MNYFYELVPQEVLDKVPYMPTLVELLSFCKADYGDLPAISDKTITRTYNELEERVARRRKFIAEQGLQAGAHIAVLCRNDLDAMELYLAVTTAGCTLMMLPNALPQPAIMGIVQKFDIDALFVADEFRTLAEGLSCKVFAASSIAKERQEAALVTKDTVAAIYFTGGTTGAPKGAVLTHGALMRGAYNGIFLRGEFYNNRYIAMLPLSHIFGSVRGMLSCFYTGALVYTCTDMRAAIGDIPVVRPTILILVPGLLEIILSVAKLKGQSFLGDLKRIVTGAAPVPPRLMKEAADLGVMVYAGYGLTEGANLTTGNSDTDINPNSMGKFYPEQNYKIVDGELWLSGDNIMKEYYKDPEKTAEVLEDGWLKTGDLVEVDEDGWLYITGRIKNLIILPNGENVSPEELEDLFYKNALIKDCMVSEMEQNGNQVIGVQVYPNMPILAGLSEEEIESKMLEVLTQVNDTLPAFKRILKLVVRKEEFVKTGAMKIDRKNN